MNWSRSDHLDFLRYTFTDTVIIVLRERISVVSSSELLRRWFMFACSTAAYWQYRETRSSFVENWNNWNWLSLNIAKTQSIIFLYSNRHISRQPIIYLNTEQLNFNKRDKILGSDVLSLYEIQRTLSINHDYSNANFVHSHMVRRTGVRTEGHHLEIGLHPTISYEQSFEFSTISMWNALSEKLAWDNLNRLMIDIREWF